MQSWSKNNFLEIKFNSKYISTKQIPYIKILKVKYTNYLIFIKQIGYLQRKLSTAYTLTIRLWLLY